jgi:hypothetical protein
MSDLEETPGREPEPLTDADIDAILNPQTLDLVKEITPDPAVAQHWCARCGGVILPLASAVGAAGKLYHDTELCRPDAAAAEQELEAVELDVEGLYNALGNKTVRGLLMFRLDKKQRLTLAKAAIAGFFDKHQVRALSLMAGELRLSATELRKQLRFEMANQSALRAEMLQKVIVRMVELCVETERREIVAVINGQREWDEGGDEDIKPMRFAR